MAIAHLLKQQISIKNPATANDGFGKPTFGSAAGMKARFERVNKTVVTVDHEREPIDGIVYVGPSGAIIVGAQVTYESELYRVIKIADVPDRRGRLHHRELMVQLWSYGT